MGGGGLKNFPKMNNRGGGGGGGRLFGTLEYTFNSVGKTENYVTVNKLP